MVLAAGAPIAPPAIKPWLWIGLAFCTIACTADARDRPAAVPVDIVRGAGRAQCDGVPFGVDPPGTLERVVGASDSTLVLFYPDARVAYVVTSDLAVKRTYRMAEAGPNAVRDGKDVAVLGDTLVVLDGAGRSLAYVLESGEVSRRVPLKVHGDRLARVSTGFVVFPTLTPQSSHSLALFKADTDATSVDIGVPAAELDDAQLFTVANLVVPLVRPHRAELLVAHQFIVPLIHRINLRASTPSWVGTIRAPVAHDLAKWAWWTPKPPFRKEELDKLLVPVLAMTEDAESIILLVRSGDKRREGFPRAFLRLSDDGTVNGSYLLDARPSFAVYLPGLERIVTATPDGDFWHCSLGPGGDSRSDESTG